MCVKELNLNSGSGAGCVCNDTGREGCLSGLLPGEVFRRLCSFCQTRFLAWVTEKFKAVVTQTYVRETGLPQEHPPSAVSDD